MKYQHKLSIPFILGLWSLVFCIPFIYSAISMYPKEFGVNTILSMLLVLGCTILAISSPAVMLKKNWGRILLSIGLHLLLFPLAYGVFTWFDSLQDKLINLSFIVAPPVLQILILHSEAFVSEFMKNKTYNQSPSGNPAPPSS
jgi:hypothetical protein